MPQIDTDQPRAGDDRESPRSEVRWRRDVSATGLIEAPIRRDPEMIPAARDEAQIALLDDAIRGNVETILYALRHNIALEHVRHRCCVAVRIPFATS
jgi:hypothetical protein